MEISVLRESDIEKLITMKETIEVSKEAFKLYSLKKTNIPLRVNIDIKKYDAQSLYMPGYIEEMNALAIKIVSVFPDNAKIGLNSVPATILLLNEKTGEVCSLLDGSYITKLRTGAIAGAATDILSNKDSEVFALIGCGGQALMQLNAVLTVRDIKLVKVFSRDENKRTNFVESAKTFFKEKLNTNIVAVNTSDEAVKDADIITTITTSNTPVFNGKLVKSGCHINGMGSYMPSMRELDEHIVISKNKIYVDTMEGVISEAGDIITPLQNRTLKKEDIAGELGEVISGIKKGREHKEEITVFKSVGSAVFDVSVAKKIYEKSINKKSEVFTFSI